MKQKNDQNDALIVFDTTSVEQRIDSLFKFKQALTLQSRAWNHQNLGFNGCVQFMAPNESNAQPKRKQFSHNNTQLIGKNKSTLLLNIIFINIEQFIKFTSLQKFECHILELIVPSTKNIIMLEGVKEWQQVNQKIASNIELDKFLLYQQIYYGVDFIECKSQEDSYNKLLILLDSVTSKEVYSQHQFNKTKLIQIQAEKCGIINFYQLNMLAMLSQIHGISQDKVLSRIYQNKGYENRSFFPISKKVDQVLGPA